MRICSQVPISISAESACSPDTLVAQTALPPDGERGFPSADHDFCQHKYPYAALWKHAPAKPAYIAPLAPQPGISQALAAAAITRIIGAGTNGGRKRRDAVTPT